MQQKMLTTKGLTYQQARELVEENDDVNAALPQASVFFNSQVKSKIDNSMRYIIFFLRIEKQYATIVRRKDISKKSANLRVFQQKISCFQSGHRITYLLFVTV